MFVDPQYDIDMFKSCLGYFQEMYEFLMELVGSIFIKEL